MKMRLILILTIAPFFCIGQNVFYPRDSMTTTERFEYRMDGLFSKVDSMLYEQKPLEVLESKIARIYWGSSGARVVIVDTTALDAYCEKYGTATHHYWYLDMNGQKIPDNIMCNSTAYQYYLFDSGNFSNLPNLPDNNRVRYVYMRYSNDVPNTMPDSWGVNGKYLQRIYFQRCGYTTAEVDALIVQLESLANQSMGNSIGSTHYFYVNSTGTNANESPTIATHTANGWTANSNYLSKIINGTSWRVYHN